MATKTKTTKTTKATSTTKAKAKAKETEDSRMARAVANITSFIDSFTLDGEDEEF